MTSSINFKKIISVGAAALLAIGGALGAGIPAHAAVATSAPVVNASVFAGEVTSATVASWDTGTSTGKWYYCMPGGSTTAATSIPAGCEPFQVSFSNVAAYTSTTFTVPMIAFCATQCTGSFGVNPVGSQVRYIEENSTAISASAAVTIREAKPITLDTLASGQTYVSLTVSGGCSFASPSMPASSDWTVTVAGTTQTINNIATANNKITLSIGSSLTGGQSVSVNYQRSNSSLITCGSFSGIANFTSALTATVPGGGGGGGGTQPCAGQTGVTSYAASAATVAPGGTFTLIYNGNPALSNCILPTTGFASARFINGTLIGTMYYSSTSTGLNVTPVTYSFTNIQAQAGRNLVNGDTYTNKIWVNPGNVQPSSSSPGDFSFTVTVTGVSGGSVSSVTAPVLTPEQARNQIKPLPVIVQPLVAAIPVLKKPMVNAGGKLDLSAGDFSGLVSASISGKPLDLILGSKGALTITVPNGEAGKTADLTLKFSTGTVIIQDAIKYVAPLVVADVPTRPVSITAGSTKLSQETADQVRQAAFANMKNNTVSCVAYAANGSAAARAAAQASAEQVCALAVKSNPDLTATPVTVIVDKAKAKTEAVGIKVYKN